MLKKEKGETNRQFQNRVISTYIRVPLLPPEDLKKVPYPLFKPIETDKEMKTVLDYWRANGITEIAIDTEFECHFNYKGIIQLCLVQVFDGTRYYLIDGVKLTQAKAPAYNAPLNVLFGSKFLRKVIFSASGDISVLRRHRIMLNNALDVQKLGEFLLMPVFSLVVYIKILLGVNVMGGRAVTDESLQASSPSKEEGEEPAEGAKEKTLAETIEMLKKGKSSKQKSDWIARPIDLNEAIYSLSDVEHLFGLRDVLLKRVVALDKSFPGMYEAATTFATINNNSYCPGNACKTCVEFMAKKIRLRGNDNAILKCVCGGFLEYSRTTYVLFGDIVPDCEVFVRSFVGLADKIHKASSEDRAPILEDLFKKVEVSLDDEQIGKLAKIVAKKIDTHIRNAEKKRKKEEMKEMMAGKKEGKDDDDDDDNDDDEKEEKEKEEERVLTSNASTDGTKKGTPEIIILRRKKAPSGPECGSGTQKDGSVPQAQQGATGEAAKTIVKLRIIRPTRKQQ